MAAILSRSETVKSEEQELTEAERKSLFQMSIEEVKAVLVDQLLYMRQVLQQKFLSSNW